MWRPDAVTPRARIPSESTTDNYEGIITMTTTGEDARPLPRGGRTIRTLEQITRLARETNTTEGNR
jgi:hypothetical protein